MFYNQILIYSKLPKFPKIKRLFIDEISQQIPLNKYKASFVYIINSSNKIYEFYDVRYKTLLPFLWLPNIKSINFKEYSNVIDERNYLYYDLILPEDHPNNIKVLNYIFKNKLKEVNNQLIVGGTNPNFKYIQDNIKHVKQRIFENLCNICNKHTNSYLICVDCQTPICVSCKYKLKQCPFCRTKNNETISFSSNPKYKHSVFEILLAEVVKPKQIAIIYSNNELKRKIPKEFKCININKCTALCGLKFENIDHLIFLCRYSIQFSSNSKNNKHVPLV